MMYKKSLQWGRDAEDTDLPRVVPLLRDVKTVTTLSLPHGSYLMTRVLRFMS